MGIYHIPCPICKELFVWFSGTPLTNTCAKCVGMNVIEASERPKSLFSIKVFKLHPDAKLPTRNISTDAGVDLFALNDVLVVVGTTTKIDTGIAVNIPRGYFGNVMDRSSMGLKGLAVGAGIIDTGYQGDCSVVLHNLNNKQDHDIFGNYGYQVKKGDKIAQLIIQPCLLEDVEEVTELWQSERGNKGWGSSGK